MDDPAGRAVELRNEELQLGDVGDPREESNRHAFGLGIVVDDCCERVGIESSSR